jgi:DNA-binding NtrC family response regulator
VSPRILVVDDDDATRQVLVRVLTREGFTVAECGTRDEALDHLRAATFDLLLTDFVMPRGSGLELVAEAARLYPALHCVVMSGHPRPEEASTAIAWVEKPIDVEQLLAALAR